jgi:hypothetical protein
MHDPSPNLSPKRREALIPPSLVGKGGRGLGLRVNLRFLNLFRRCLIDKYSIFAFAIVLGYVLLIDDKPESDAFSSPSETLREREASLREASLTPLRC